MNGDRICELKHTQSQMETFLMKSLDFWLKKGISEKGGYFVCFDDQGEPMKTLEVLKPTDKMIVTQTRMIWGFSAMLRGGLLKDESIKESCRRAAGQGVDFLINHFWDSSNGGFAWYTDEDGTVMDNGKLVYGQTFAIYALAEYSLATNDQTGLVYAEKTFDCLMKYCVDTAHGGYYENMSADWIPEKGMDHGENLKSLDIHMHIIEAFTTLYECSKKEIHKRRLEEVIDVVRNHMIDYQNHCGGNQFTLDFKPKEARDIRRTWNYERDPEHTNQRPIDSTSYGHNMELVWLLNRAYQVMGKAPDGEISKMIAENTIACGWDNKYGGLFRDGLHDGTVVVREKEWWQNFEALTSFLDCYQVTGDERYLDKYLELWAFDYQYFYNQQVGESGQLLKEDGTSILTDIGNQWKCIYHTDRAMIECILRSKKILNSLPV